MPYKDKAAKRSYQNAWMKRRRQEWLDENGPCDCGSEIDLEMHHKDPSQKVSHRIWNWAKARRLRELAKCEVRCGTCHKGKHSRAGVLNPSAKLSESDIMEIRRCLALGQKQKDIANRHRVDQSHISKIKRGLKWSNIGL